MFGREEKLFKQISDALNSGGHPTFRYDKRGVTNSQGQVDPAIWETADRVHLIQDAVDAAKTLLRSTSSEAKDLIVLGHSKGTILAVETAIALGGQVRGLILLGAQARSMKDMLRYQVLESRSLQSSGVGSEEPPEREFEKIVRMIESSRDKFAPDGKPMEWYRQHLAAPANADRLRLVNAKVAVFQGKVDPQTPIDELQLLTKAGRKDLMIFQYEGLGHGFSPDKNGQPTLGPIEDSVITDIVNTAARF